VFGGYTGGRCGNLSLKLKGDTAVFDYKPVYYVKRDFPGHDPLTDKDAAKIVDWCVAGVKQWEGKYKIRGHTLTLTVNVDAKLTADKLKANVFVIPRDRLGFVRSQVIFPALVWRPKVPTYTLLCPEDPRNEQYMTRVSAHEFGHALGLNDAYGYGNYFRPEVFFSKIVNPVLGWIQPEAPEDRAPRDAIMRSNRTIYDRDVEMVLWAWKHGKMQLYTESILMYLYFFEVSPAFSQ